ncbi:DNA-binding transcriptional regulator YhcF, GntR family [Actinopolyspora xinjiangensis]|uniref:DNA-binding transcriptional regulator YhcF, GntR family n=1 Tax=Actinopolyspora xinjiangensis TaxID=405564 RepID=A0A1H0RIN2_9ACTN|nr:DNA-binding transcriptional regulator YhcF, GntR family [Actinopolyspora xinjiangensis]
MDPDLGATLHEQITGVVRRAISEGSLAPGERLPTARELAKRLQVNLNTVLRAYRELANEELIELRRGHGATVLAEPDLARLYRLADELLAEAARMGVTRGELAALLARRS